MKQKASPRWCFCPKISESSFFIREILYEFTGSSTSSFRRSEGGLGRLGLEVLIRQCGTCKTSVSTSQNRHLFEKSSYNFFLLEIFNKFVRPRKFEIYLRKIYKGESFKKCSKFYKGNPLYIRSGQFIKEIPL